MKTRWDLNELFSDCTDSSWLRDQLKSSSNQRDESKLQYLWAAAKAHSLKGTPGDWEVDSLLEEETNQELHEPKSLCLNQLVASSGGLESARKQLGDWRIEGLNLHGAIASNRRDLHHAAFRYQIEVALRSKEALLKEAVCIAGLDKIAIARAQRAAPAKLEISKNSLKSNLEFLAGLCAEISRPLHPYELLSCHGFDRLSCSESQRDPMGNTKNDSERMIKNIVGFFSSIHTNWGEKALAVFQEGRADLCKEPKKMPGAMAFPWKKYRGPLVYIHDALSGEVGSSDLSLVHELGHAIHFHSYCESSDWHSLPPDEVLEVFPHFVEDMYLLHNDKPQRRALRRAYMLNLQWCWLEFRYRKAFKIEAGLDLDTVEEVCRTLWQQVVHEAFGETLVHEFSIAPIWLIHSMATSPWDDCIPYLSGPNIAFGLADKCLSDHTVSQNIDLLLKEGSFTQPAHWIQCIE